jgi:hypothetical protein
MYRMVCPARLLEWLCAQSEGGCFHTLSWISKRRSNTVTMTALECNRLNMHVGSVNDLLMQPDAEFLRQRVCVYQCKDGTAIWDVGALLMCQIPFKMIYIFKGIAHEH